ncbi:MAG: type II CAAX prenyl endopeptidase Rce1 family protein [Candidatus Hodarchaeota archaeon]
MPKIVITEIENSFLNFFTPAMIIVASLFLSFIICKPLLLFINWWIQEADIIGIDFSVIKAIIAIWTGILISLITYYVFIPRLKVIYVEYHPPQLKNLIYIFPVFFIIILFRNVAIFLYELGGDTVPYSQWPGFLQSSLGQLRNPTLFILYLIYQFIIISITYELLYRRTVIPALEDRGLSPLYSVILSSFGFSLVFVPDYILIGNLFGTIFWAFSTFLYGLATGIIYILTRNILFSWFYAIIYLIYRNTGELGSYFQNPFLLSIRFFLDLVILIVGIITLILVILRLLERKTSKSWVKILKTSSVPKIERGVIGFLIISFFFVSLELVVVNVIETITEGNMPAEFLLFLIFDLLAFSIPFLLTIKTEFTLS